MLDSHWREKVPVDLHNLTRALDGVACYRGDVLYRCTTLGQCEAEDRDYRASFRPHRRVETECERPSPIFLVAMLGLLGLRIVPISDAM